MFNTIVYYMISPLLLYNSIKQKDIKLFICFMLILLSHIYKDYQKNKNWKWPLWTEPIGFLIGCIFLLAKFCSKTV